MKQQPSAKPGASGAQGSRSLWYPALMLGACLALGAASAGAGTITTLFAANNGGSNGGAVYFDLLTGPNAITITGLTTNTADVLGATAGFSVYTRLGSAQGAEGVIGLWGLVTGATVTPSGANNPSPVLLDSVIGLSANTLYGFALVMPATVGHDYTNGTCGVPYTQTGNCFATNSDLTLVLGSAKNIPFSGGAAISPRVWNGSIEYEVVPVPGSLALVLLGISGLGWRRHMRR